MEFFQNNEYNLFELFVRGNLLHKPLFQTAPYTIKQNIRQQVRIQEDNQIWPRSLCKDNTVAMQMKALKQISSVWNGKGRL